MAILTPSCNIPRLFTPPMILSFIRYFIFPLFLFLYFFLFFHAPLCFHILFLFYSLSYVLFLPYYLHVPISLTKPFIIPFLLIKITKLCNLQRITIGNLVDHIITIQVKQTKKKKKIVNNFYFFNLYNCTCAIWSNQSTRIIWLLLYNIRNVYKTKIPIQKWCVYTYL